MSSPSPAPSGAAPGARSGAATIGAAVSCPAQAAAPATSASPQPRIVIRYRKSEQNALGEGIRIAAELQSTAAQVELLAATSGFRTPTILYFRAEDRAAAEALALRLGQGTAWVVRPPSRGRRPAASKSGFPDGRDCPIGPGKA